MKDVELSFRLFVAKSGIRQVHLAVGGQEAEVPLDLDLADRHLMEALDDVECGTCSKETLREVGARLWSALMAGAVGELFEAVRKEREDGVRYLLCLHVEDRPLDLLPWEALYEDDPRGGARFLATHPAYAIVRTPLAGEPPGEPPPLTGPLHVLAVIPSGSGLDVTREVKNLEDCVARVSERVVLERLAGQVTPSRLRDKLRAGPWDVFHFIGHGQQSEKSGRTEVRLNSEEALDEDFWLDGETLADLFKGAGLRLAVLNCCQAGTPVEGRRLSGVGPSFLAAGVPAVVAMRYEIGDREANTFARELYQELLAGREPGRVDRAVESARELLNVNQPEDVGRPFITPLLFLSGSPRIFDLASPAASPSPSVLAASAAAAPRITVCAPAEFPATLVRVLAAGQCVPVIGPRVLSAGAVRSDPPASDLRQLAGTLAQRFSYPRSRDFDLCAAGGDWMDTFLLQWVCQLVQACNRPRDLVAAIEDVYRGALPPAVLSHVAGWNVPGLFYLHFDGLLEEAFAERSRRVRVVQGVDAAVPQGDLPLLVHVRGSFRDPASLVLTEDDHNDLWDRIGRMSQEIVNLVRGYDGRSLFFLGVSPRDPLVKRLFSKLIEGWHERARGPLFFLCSGEEKGDCFWNQAQVEWIDADLEAVVEGLTAAMASGGKG
ncbi:MAG TPA: CHAT domain-containing protein [Thermoanaerobaculia bacterium]|nr:CHAT domain-containing protein [Thermoanaerobaculia bacterium]